MLTQKNKFLEEDELSETMPENVSTIMGLIEKSTSKWGDIPKKCVSQYLDQIQQITNTFHYSIGKYDSIDNDSFCVACLKDFYTSFITPSEKNSDHSETSQGEIALNQRIKNLVPTNYRESRVPGTVVNPIATTILAEQVITLKEKISSDYVIFTEIINTENQMNPEQDESIAVTIISYKQAPRAVVFKIYPNSPLQNNTTFPLLRK